MDQEQENREEQDGPATSPSGAAGALPWKVYAGRVERAAGEVKGPPSGVRRSPPPVAPECQRNGHAGPCRFPGCPFRVLPLDGPPSSGRWPNGVA